MLEKLKMDSITKRYAAKRFRSCAVVLALTFLPSQLWAAAFWNLGQGNSSYGRAGANIVDPGDPTAVFLNPAALVSLDGFQFVVGANMIKDSRTFQRTPVEGLGPEGPFEEVTNQQTPLPSPNFFFSYNFASLGLDKMSAGLGVWGPPRADMIFDPVGPQRYSVVESKNIQAHFAFALAYDLEWVQLGAAFVGTYQKIDTLLTLNSSLVCLGAPEDIDCDIGTHINAEQPFIPGAIFGLTIPITDGLEFAASYQLPYDVVAPGNATLTPGDAYFKRNGESLVAFESENENNINVSLNLPGIARAALRYTDEAAKFDVELAFVYENWSRNSTITFDATAIQIVPHEDVGSLLEPGPVGVLELTPNWRDTYSLRLGGGYEVMEDLVTARAGIYYERSAVEDKWLNVSNYDADKIGTTVGARIEIPGGLWTDLAFGYVNFMSKTVTNSGTLSDDPTVPNEDDPATEAVEEPEARWPIADGHYSSQMIVFMAAIGGSFDL